MKLATEIIDILSSETPNLANALFKTKVLLHKLGEKELIQWVNSELNGYKSNDDVPEYRVVQSRVMANLMNLVYSASNRELPIYHLDHELRKSLEQTKFGHSIAALESLANSESESVQRPVPIALHAKLNEPLGNGYQVQEAWCEISHSSLAQILAEVRSRLLDFVLELSDKLPEQASDAELKEMSNEIDTKSLFNNSVIGDNATILVGDHSSQTVSNNIIKGDFDSLAKHLSDNSVEEDDIKSLRQAIEQDEQLVDHENKQYGTNVKLWITEMLGKAVESVWNINIGVAGSLIATAINSYYGWF